MRSEKKKSRTAADTERQRALRTCRRHLEDLRRAHKHPPDDVRVKSVSVPKYLEPAAPSSYQSSPSQLCSELGE
jgi:type II secretory pathway pseudopilin PulG